MSNGAKRAFEIAEADRSIDRGIQLSPHCTAMHQNITLDVSRSISNRRLYGGAVALNKYKKEQVLGSGADQPNRLGDIVDSCSWVFQSLVNNPSPWSKGLKLGERQSGKECGDGGHSNRPWKSKVGVDGQGNRDSQQDRLPTWGCPLFSSSEVLR